MKTAFLLDTSALLAARNGERGCERVAVLLRDARDGRHGCLACFMTLTELYYRVWKIDLAQERLPYK